MHSMGRVKYIKNTFLNYYFKSFKKKKLWLRLYYWKVN